MQTITQLHQQAISLINQRLYVQAHPICVQILKLQPDHADSYFLLGVIHVEIGQVRKSIALFEKAISLKPQADYYCQLAKSASLLGNAQQVLHAANKVPLESIETPLTLDTIGVALSRVAEHASALGYFKKAISLDKNVASYYYNAGVSGKFCGNFSDAREYFERAIALNSDYHQAHFALSDLGGITSSNNHIERLLAVNAKAQDSIEASLHYGHALSKEYEALGDFGAAFNALANAKSKRAEKWDYDVANHEAMLNEACESATFSSADAGCSNSRPIFIVGMPRSGTTLIDRVLSHHSEVSSAGELQDFGMAVKELAKTSSNQVLDIETLRQAKKLDPIALGKRYIERTEPVSGNARFFIDKLPFNFFYIHLIRQSLPNAKIICVLRDPLDTCIGNYRQLFSIHNPNYHYSNDLPSLGRFYSGFHRLMSRWRELGDDGIYFVDYESFVTNPEKEARALLSFCQLEWQKQCLQVEKNLSPVSTASNVQVREPINTRSIGRWRRFQPHLDNLQAYLIEQGILPKAND